MPEVCSIGFAKGQDNHSDDRPRRIRPAEFPVTATTDRFHPQQRLPRRYQNTIRNTYAVVTRPPQTRAAHFKRLYRK